MTKTSRIDIEMAELHARLDREIDESLYRRRERGYSKVNEAASGLAIAKYNLAAVWLDSTAIGVDRKIKALTRPQNVPEDKWDWDADTVTELLKELTFLRRQVVATYKANKKAVSACRYHDSTDATIAAWTTTT